MDAAGNFKNKKRLSRQNNVRMGSEIASSSIDEEY